MTILKNQLEQTKLGLKGQTPKTRAGALETSTLHSEIKPENSIHDLDGSTPNKYTDNLPE